MSAANAPGWATVSELARIRGVSKVAVSKRVARLEARGLLQTRRGPRGTKLISIAAFDQAAHDATDGVRELNGRSAAKPTDPVLSKEQARRTKADADLKELDRDERLGQLVRGGKIEEAMADALRMHARIIDQIAMRAEENEAAVRKDGIPGARAFLRRLAHDLREDIADRASEIARQAEQRGNESDG